MTEKEFNKQCENVGGFTLWRTSKGWQANLQRKGSSGWAISIDKSAYKAVKGVFKGSHEDDISDLA